MNYWLICLFFLVLLFLTIIIISFVIYFKKEKYYLMRDIGKTTIPINNHILSYILDDEDDNLSLKYRNHRYDIHKIRSNPHVRRYQDNLVL